MKRMVISVCVAAIAATVLAAPAGAAVKHFEGTVTGGGTIAFDAKFNKHGVPKSAGYFTFSHIPVQCDDSKGGVNFSYNDVVPVTDRKFSYVFHSFKARFNGTIKTNGTKAFGKVSYGPNPARGAHQLHHGRPEGLDGVHLGA